MIPTCIICIFVHTLLDNSPFTSIIKYLTDRKKRYVYKVVKEQVPNAKYYMDGLGNTFKIIFATEYMSEIGHAALAYPDHEDLHYICVINPVTNTCSLRSRKGETNVAKLAKLFDGGGHRSAAGFPIQLTEIIESIIFKTLNNVNL